MKKNLIPAALSTVADGIARFAEEHPDYAAGLQIEVIISARSISKMPPEVLAELADTKVMLCFPAKPNDKKKPNGRNGIGSANGVAAVAVS